MANYHDLDTPSSSETPPPAPNGSNNRTFLTLMGILGAIFLVALALMATYLLVIRPRQMAPANQASQQAKSLEMQTSTALVATRNVLLQAITETPGAVSAATTTGLPAPAEITPSPVVTIIPTQVSGYPAPSGPASTPTLPASSTQSGSPTTNQTLAPNQAAGTLPPATPSPSATPVLIDARTATVAALLTQAAANGQPTRALGVVQTPAIGGAGTLPSPTPTALPKTGFAEDAGIPGLMGIAVALLIVIVVARGLRTRTS